MPPGLSTAVWALHRDGVTRPASFFFPLPSSSFLVRAESIFGSPQLGHSTRPRRWHWESRGPSSPFPSSRLSWDMQGPWTGGRCYLQPRLGSTLFASSPFLFLRCGSEAWDLEKLSSANLTSRAEPQHADATRVQVGSV